MCRHDQKWRFQYGARQWFYHEANMLVLVLEFQEYSANMNSASLHWAPVVLRQGPPRTLPGLSYFPFAIFITDDQPDLVLQIPHRKSINCVIARYSWHVLSSRFKTTFALCTPYWVLVKPTLGVN